MIELTELQIPELSALEPIVINPQTQTKYVLVRQDVYKRVKALIASDDYDTDEGGRT